MAKKKPLQSPPQSQAKATPQPQPETVAVVHHFASMHPGTSQPVPAELVASIVEIERVLQLPVWLLVQDGVQEESQRGRDSFNMIGNIVSTAFFQARHGELQRGQKVALLIDSNGGMAGPAYELAMLLRRHCGGFVALIPRHAKSAATLLTLGADAIIMNDHAELGPLDVQIWDADREEQMSGLDEVQSLERLQAFAMDAFDRIMLMLIRRTGKKIKTLTPMVGEFVTNLTKPMFQGIDVVRYTQMSRLLKVGEEYGKRLLKRVYGDGKAETIAKKLVTDYPEHGFPIYPDDAKALGLKLVTVPDSLRGVMEDVTQYLPGQNLVGRIATGGHKP